MAEGGARDEALRRAVAEGLGRRPPRLDPKLLYDERGSRLFEAICVQPEYYIPELEMGLLEELAAPLAELVGPGSTLVELGSGASRKVRLLLEALRPSAYLGIDISCRFLEASVARLAADYPWLRCEAACRDYSAPFAVEPPGAGRRVAFFPGSSIGNFEPGAARALLQRLRALAGADGGLLIGVDLPKDAATLHRAYNDEAGYTAAFNRNLLRRLRDELGAGVDPDGFAHLAYYNPAAGRVEMHLLSRREQAIELDGRRFRLSAGESIHTESSYKYTLGAFRRLAREAGWRPRRVWTDAREWFSVHYLEADTSRA